MKRETQVRWLQNDGTVLLSVSPGGHFTIYPSGLDRAGLAELGEAIQHALEFTSKTGEPTELPKD